MSIINNKRQLENPSTTLDESIKRILERLNILIDRQHAVYHRIETILSELIILKSRFN